MEKINELIFKLTALFNACKDIHYRNVGYESHLLADRIIEEVGESSLDDLKEQCILANRNLPLSSKEYLEGAIPFIPAIGENNRANFIALSSLVDSIRQLIDTEMKFTDRGTNALIDNIGQGLNTASALLYIQTRRTVGLNEEVEHDREASQETPVDREPVKQPEIDMKKVAKEVRKNEEENLLVAESVLDRVSKKLGI